MTQVNNSLFLQALNCQGPARAPIWLMRQAGRYMPQYQAIRSKYEFLEMCHQPELAAQVTMLPIDLLGVDAAILFSDILVILEAFKIEYNFVEGVGPVITKPLENGTDIDRLEYTPVEESLSYIPKIIENLLPNLSVPLIGFCGAPFTIASYLIEGSGSRDFKKTKKWMYQDPTTFHKLLQKIQQATLDYMKLQEKAGVHAIQIFDSSTYILSSQSFRQFSLNYLDKILTRWRRENSVPLIMFCRGSSVFAPELVQMRPAAVSVDWQAELSQVRLFTPENIALQGNLDPDVLYADHKTIIREATKILDDMKGDRGFIFNLGHGIKPDMSFDAVKCLVDCVKNYR